MHSPVPAKTEAKPGVLESPCNQCGFSAVEFLVLSANVAAIYSTVGCTMPDRDRAAMTDALGETLHRLWRVIEVAARRRPGEFVHGEAAGARQGESRAEIRRGGGRSGYRGRQGRPRGARRRKRGCAVSSHGDVGGDRGQPLRCRGRTGAARGDFGDFRKEGAQGARLRAQTEGSSDGGYGIAAGRGAGAGRVLVGAARSGSQRSSARMSSAG